MDRLIQVRNTIGLDKEIFVIRFGAQKNRLIEAVLLNTQNKYFV